MPVFERHKRVYKNTHKIPANKCQITGQGFFFYSRIKTMSGRYSFGLEDHVCNSPLKGSN